MCLLEFIRMYYKKFFVGGIFVLLVMMFVFQKDNVLKGQFYPEDEFQDDRPDCVIGGACPGGGDGLIMNEGDAIDISCSGNQVIQITDAIYGTNCPGYDDSPSDPSGIDGEMGSYIDYGNQYECTGACSDCNGQSSCTFSMDNNHCGDTCYGTYKKGTLSYTCVDSTDIGNQEDSFCPYQAPEDPCLSVAVSPMRNFFAQLFPRFIAAEKIPAGCAAYCCNEVGPNNTCGYVDSRFATCAQGGMFLVVDYGDQAQAQCNNFCGLRDSCYDCVQGCIDKAGGGNAIEVHLCTAQCVDQTTGESCTSAVCGGDSGLVMCENSAQCCPKGCEKTDPLPGDLAKCIKEAEEKGLSEDTCYYFKCVDYSTAPIGGGGGGNTPNGGNTPGGGGTSIGGGNGSGGGSGSGGGNGGDNGGTEDEEEDEEEEPDECAEGEELQEQFVCVPPSCSTCYSDFFECGDGEECQSALDNCCEPVQCDNSQPNCGCVMVPAGSQCATTGGDSGSPGTSDPPNNPNPPSNPPNASSARAPSSAASSQPSGCQSDNECSVNNSDCTGYCQGDGSCIAVCTPTTSDCSDLDCRTAYCGTDGCGGCCPVNPTSSTPTSSRPTSSRPTSSTPHSFSNSSKPNSSTPTSSTPSSSRGSSTPAGYCCINNFCSNCAGGGPLNQCMASCGAECDPDPICPTPEEGCRYDTEAEVADCECAPIICDDSSSSASTTHSPQASSTYSGFSDHSSQSSGLSLQSSTYSGFSVHSSTSSTKTVASVSSAFSFFFSSRFSSYTSYEYSSASSAYSALHAPVCGDGSVNQGFEQCDDGNVLNYDGCNSSCQKEKKYSGSSISRPITYIPPGTPDLSPPVCGDFRLQYGEQCDDGNTSNGDGCGWDCRLEPGIAPQCGDGIVTIGEQCDDGNMDKFDGCNVQCIFEPKEPPIVAAASICGNGILEQYEECDDSNRKEGDGCSSSCLLEIGICGDGIVQTLMGEQCEQSVHNADLPYTCEECRFVSLFCGDGNVDAGEECDDADQNSTNADAHCRPDCSISRCGDAILDSAELCDDGNRKNNDGCDAYCRVEEGKPGVTVIAAEQNINFPQSTPFIPIQLPLAQLQPLIQGTAPIGDTGPAAVAIIAAGAGSGLAWVRKKRRRKS